MTGQESDDEQEPVGSARVTQARAAGVLVIGQIAATLADVLTPLVLVRYLEREELGLLGGLLLVYQTTPMVVASGIPRSVLYFLPGRERAVRAAIAWRLSGMLATTIIQPIDMIKVRIQIGDKGGPVSHRTASKIAENLTSLLSHSSPSVLISSRRTDSWLFTRAWTPAY